MRRPLAFAGFCGGLVFAIYQIKGRGTRALASADPGASVDIIGPLGKGFLLPEAGPGAAGRRPFIIGGGVGIGPLLFLHSRIPSAALRLGFRTASAVPVLSQRLKAQPELREIADSLAQARCATDDGSAGFRGTVVESLLFELDGSVERPLIFACGPSPMLAAISRLAEARGIPAQVSVEQWMACGVGACQGCAVPLRSGGYARACSDGPVFDSALLDWEAWR